MVSSPELLILGAGPAGIGAALAASETGVDTTLVDRAPTGGGQVYRAPITDANLQQVNKDTGTRLRERLAGSSVKQVFDCNVWSIRKDFRVDAISPDGPRTWAPKAIIGSLGTTERVVPFEGWTTPGVFGLAATTLLLKSQLMLPGDSCVVAGSGPLLAGVAHGIISAGGTVTAIVDIASRGSWLASVPALMSRPKDLMRGAGWLNKIRLSKVPVFYRHAVESVQNDDTNLEITIAPVDQEGRKRVGAKRTRFVAESLSIGNGLTPASDLTKLLGAKHLFCGDSGGWVPEIDQGQRTTVKNLYAAGDGTGVTGADAAFVEGQIAGYTVAFDQGRITQQDYDKLVNPLRKKLERVSRAGRQMARMMAVRPGQVADIEPDTIVCRCEDVTRKDVDAAIDRGATDINQIKSWTRCGMGPCQGKTCGDMIAALVAEKGSGRSSIGYWTPRTPLTAVTMKDLAGDFSYEDIRVPKAAPL